MKVGARRHFRDDAAEGLMLFALGADAVGMDLPIAGHHGGRRFIAARLDAEYPQRPFPDRCHRL
ncbi:hypothetical protein DF3PB_4370003 [uncultured Defluviicoccus sp.]|uniref:Uncharacterized protein n=1 Tax=metagenome TaxID=256318 RepID=A0A380TG73_9ZZZZ|nr:hypothetical protein DF3PB_130002 [uncultured Defluviicoccus sp.]SUS07435.1 hypothetical protein DF3PB_4370003 [uncultured Defluviicoccus sp.]